VQNGRLGASFSTTALHIPLHAMQVLAVFVFLFCCCNLALLFVGRAKREAQSVAIRIALGARLGNEMRYAMLEATALSAIGCLIAVPIAWSTALILSLVIQSIRGFNSFPTTSPSATLLLAASGATLTIACMVGAGSSFWYGRKPASISLKGRHGASVARSKSWIIGFEVFATMLLATIAVVDVVGFQKQANQPAGFTTSSTILASLDLTGNSSNNETIMNKENRILDRIEGSPGVQAVAEINVPPISGSEASGILTARGKDGAMQKQKIWPADVSVSYFSAIGTRIVRGRDFAMDDLAGNPVCILSSRASSAFFSGEDPLGKFLYQGGDTTNNEALALYCRVVGIAEDAHFESMSDPADSVVYRLTKEEMSNIIVKAATNELAIQAVRNAVRMVDQEGMAPRIDTIQAHIEDDLRIWRVITLSGTLCACISAVILGIGFFGILALQVAERRREIGIQIALGANRTQVCISVMKTLRHAVLAGLVLGSATALLAANALAQFYNLSARFVIGGYLGSLVLLGVLLFAAAAVPLRRALAVSPMECLASE